MKPDWPDGIPRLGARPQQIGPPDGIAPAPPPVEIFAPVRATALIRHKVPEREWLVPEWIPMRRVTILAGDGAVGKTLVATQLMVSAALGRPWLGMPVQRVPSFGLFAEDDRDEVHERLANIVEQAGASLEDLPDIYFDARGGKDSTLMSFAPGAWQGDTSELYGAVMLWAVRTKARLIVIDTASDVFLGNEIVRPQVRQFITKLRALAQTCDAAVVLTTHPSITGRSSGSGESGSTAWNNSARSRLYLMRQEANGEGEPHPDVRVLKRMKANYARRGDEIQMRWAPPGVMVAEGAPVGIDRIALNAKADRIFVEGVRQLATQGVRVSQKKSPTFAPSVIAKLPSSEGVPSRTLEAAMWRAIQANRVRVEEDGSPSRRRSFLALVEDPPL